MRFRHLYMGFGTAVAIGALLLSDPDNGVSTVLLLISLLTPLLAVVFAHLSRKALHDYPEADMQTLFKRAGEHPIGAGLALVALSIVLYGLLGLFGRATNAQDVRTYIPSNAIKHQATIGKELAFYWPDHPRPELIPALIEHESCIGLRHSRCWSSTSRLKSAREEGAGLGQLTRAWRDDGSLRFDKLQELKETYPALRELSWNNVYQRPDLQIRSLVLMNLYNYNQLQVVKDPWQRLAMADAAYNGGLGGVLKERRACYLLADCLSQQWFGHVEKHCLKSRVALYGGRSACDINRYHVRDVLLTRSNKYVNWVPL